MNHEPASPVLKHPIATGAIVPNPPGRASEPSEGIARTSRLATRDLLLACCFPNPDQNHVARIQHLLREQVDWSELLRLAEHHGTSALLYQGLSKAGAGVPVTTLTSLRQQFERNVHKSLFLTRELIRILERLQTLGIGVVPYKGVTLSEAYYGDMALRQSGDIDLFVRRQDVARITDTVRELGYEPHLTFSPAAQSAYIASGYECTFDSSAGRNVLELQWQLQPRFYAVDYDMDGLFQRAETVQVGGCTMKTPSPEDLLLVLSVHAAKHTWGRLIWLCDIAQVLKRPNLDWDWIQARAHEVGVERILCITLLLTQQLLNTEIPAPVERGIEKDGTVRRLTEEIKTTLARDTSYNVESLSYFRLMRRVRERRADRWRFLTRLIFTPGPGEWEAIPLPAALFPFYRVIRLGRLIARLARR